MSIINILDKNTINQIAAGEVIERPASIVKELIENSIDAGAKAVSCEIKGGGTELIRVTDDGNGIAAEDIRTAFVRHATSKIKSASDLNNIFSLGFRGEALPSIAAVAKVELITRQEDSFEGSRYVIENGEELAFESIGCPKGTTVIVRDLFKNIPVRRKFLKSPQTEAGYVNELVERIATAHPEVSIKFINNGRISIFTSGNNSVKDIIYGIYGREITASLIEVNGSDSAIQVKGFVARPIVARSNRNNENYYVNGRFIRSNVISKAVEDAFAPFLMQHKYPFTALMIEVPPQVMDVNVHPTKQEVRFENPEAIYNAVYTAVLGALKAALLIPKAITENTGAQAGTASKLQSKDAPEPFELSRRIPQVNDTRVNYGNSSRTQNTGNQNEETKNTEGNLFSKNDLKADTSKQDSTEIDIHNTANLNPQTSEAVRPEDAVRTAEAVRTADAAKSADAVGTAEALVNWSADEAGDNRTKPADNSSKPETAAINCGKQFAFNLNSEDNTISDIHEETKKEFLEGLNSGYKIVGQVFNTYWVVERGNDMFIIDQHAAHEKIIYESIVSAHEEGLNDSQLLSPPKIISLSANECNAIEEHMSELEAVGYRIESFGGREFTVTGVPVNMYSLDPISILMELTSSFAEGKSAGGLVISLKERLATCACKAAVKGNTRISHEEAQSLIEQLLKLDNPFNCPHGRPVIINMTKSELEKKFKRII